MLTRQKIILRTANDADFRRFFRVDPPEFIGIAAENEYMIVGLGGIVNLQDQWWLFLRRAPGVKGNVSLMRAAKVITEVAKDFEQPVKAVCNLQITGAEKLLKHLGLTLTEETYGGEPVWTL